MISGKWTLLIIYQINERVVRYGELKRNIVGISEKILISQLKFLVEKGLVQRTVYPEIPPKVEYTLTEVGKELLPIVYSIIDFGLEHVLGRKKD